MKTGVSRQETVVSSQNNTENRNKKLNIQQGISNEEVTKAILLEFKQYYIFHHSLLDI